MPPPPPGDPETINAWELMEGLEEDDDSGAEEAISPRQSAGRSPASSSPRSTNESPPLKPISSILTSSFDPSQLIPSPELEKTTIAQCNQHKAPELEDIVKERITAFKEKMDARTIKLSPPAAGGCPPDGEGRVVVYSTSLRGVRKMHEDCTLVHIILTGYGILLDERDVSMHGGFKEELSRLIGRAGCGGGQLPRIFASGTDLGGVDEVREMHEAGKLAKALARCEMSPMTKKGGSGDGWCGGCGDMRFVPCNKCCGSCKVYVEEEEKAIGGFRRCLDCNENGLIRCPVCFLR